MASEEPTPQEDPAQDEATATEWAVWDNPSYPAHSPFAGGRLVVWVMDYAYPQDLMGHVVGGGRAYMGLRITPERVSDPQCWWTGDRDPDIRAFIAWRQGGGLWGRALWAWEPEQIVADYSGPFSLKGDIVTWDGGSADLREMAMAQVPIPEPSALTMLVIGLLCAAWHINSRQGISSGLRPRR